MAQSKKNSFLSLNISRTWLLIGISLAVLLIGGTVYAIYSKNKKTVSTIPSTTSSQDDSSSAGDSGNSASNSSNSSAGSSQTETGSDKQSQPSPTSTLLKPFGQFVSNHYPTLSGQMAEQQSVCNTTPGATCYIKFTKGGDTRQLEAKTADSNGTVSWKWNVGTASLSQGSWTITAVAALNGQTQTAQDAQNLEVQP